MNVHLAKLLMYFEIHRMRREGHSLSHISEHLAVNRRTVSKYLSMSEKDYEAFLDRQSDRKKILLPYEDFIKESLEKFRDTSAAQMHDWLKERFADFPVVSPKTVFNFVCWVREKHRLPVVKAERQYQSVEELPYGKQAQVDFGAYNMRTTTGGRVKVFFFTMVLSRSRFKYTWFTDTHFTAVLAIQAHEKAFEYIRGIPDEIVYDQDKVFIVSENHGDIILTDAFRTYMRGQSFGLHFCRKADPESKGKVENVVKYVKQNFLYNRSFHNIETLNDEAMGWLGRTANALPHAFTRKDPYSEWIIEQSFLRPYQAYAASVLPISPYAVRKDNTISYKGNFYSLPLGTYKGKSTMVAVVIEKGYLIISDERGKQEICRHQVALGKGIKVTNTNHKRDKSAVIDEMILQVCALFSDAGKAQEWLDMIRVDKPRYIRDQLIMIRESVTGINPEQVGKALDYCVSNNITSASDFKSILKSQETDKTNTKIIRLNPLSGNIPAASQVKPDASSIKDYESILKNNQ